MLLLFINKKPSRIDYPPIPVIRCSKIHSNPALCCNDKQAFEETEKLEVNFTSAAIGSQKGIVGKPDPI
jgi:hypothetical protein